MANQVPLNRVLPAIDRKNRSFYDKLSQEERKAMSLFLLNRYASSVNAGPDLEMYWLLSTNRRVNNGFFELNQHPKLQWLLLTTASPGVGTVRHEWIAFKQKRAGSKTLKFLEDLYPTMKADELAMLDQLCTREDLKQLARDHGWEEKEIKQMFK